MRRFFLCMVFVLAGCTSLPTVPVRRTDSPPVEVVKPEPPPLPRTVFTTVGEILKSPILFNGQMVRLKGKVSRVQPPPQSDKAPTVFDLVEGSGEALSVKTTQRVDVDDGSIVTIEGRINVGDPTAPAPTDVGVIEAQLIATQPQPEKKKLLTPAAAQAAPQQAQKAQDVAPIPEIPAPDPPLKQDQDRDPDEGRIF